MPFTVISNETGQFARITPYPVENCYNYCFLTFENLVEAGTQAAATVEVTGANQTDGEKFTFAGVEFEIGTYSTFNTSGGYLVQWTQGNSGLNANALAQAIAEHPLFKNKVTVTATLVGVSFVVIVEWNCPGEQPNWEFDFSGLTNPPGFFELNGDPIIPVPGIKVGYRLQFPDEGQWLTDVQQIPLITDCQGNSNEICIDVHRDLSKIVSTTIPECSVGEVKIDETIMKRANIHFGLLRSNEDTGCGVWYWDWSQSQPQRFINSAWNVDFGAFSFLDPVTFIPRGWVDYSYNIFNAGADQNIKFLTLVPAIRSLCSDVCDHVWLIINTPTITTYRARYQFFDSAGALLNTTNIDFDAENQVVILPSGPKNVLENVLSDQTIIPDICYYEYAVFAFLDFFPFTYKYSETRRVNIVKGCCESIGIYFLDPLGGYSYMPLDYVDSETYTSSFTEVCRETQCINSYREKLKGNKYNRNSNLQSKRVLRSREWQRNEVNRLIFKAFKGSEYHYMLVDGEPKHVLLSSEETRIFQYREYLELFVTVVDAQEWKNQSDQ